MDKRLNDEFMSRQDTLFWDREAACEWINFRIKESKLKDKNMEDPGIDPGASRMLSERSTIWARPPSYKYTTDTTS